MTSHSVKGVLHAFKLMDKLQKYLGHSSKPSVPFYVADASKHDVQTQHGVMNVFASS